MLNSFDSEKIMKPPILQLSINTQCTHIDIFVIT